MVDGVRLVVGCWCLVVGDGHAYFQKGHEERNGLKNVYESPNASANSPSQQFQMSSFWKSERGGKVPCKSPAKVEAHDGGPREHPHR